MTRPVLSPSERSLTHLTLVMRELEASWVFRRWLECPDVEHGEVARFVLQVAPELWDLPDDVLDTHVRELMDRVSVLNALVGRRRAS
ncbi:hypothetical protein [Deinococcus pimensis]|uniref:hypothetical protein n=1 Tax=Deinococcus pimensis TaxID=309888 RepID=UPI0004831C9C|nr:hypothetical protein [Deinococcus pimensis]